MAYARNIFLIRLAALLLIFAGLAYWRVQPILREREREREFRTHFSVADRLRQYEPASTARLKPYFEGAGVAYPPARVVFLAFKSERRLQLYAAGKDEPLRFVHEYMIQGASGTLGPKLEEGDSQVPEGIYNIDSLNPNSLCHISMRVDYPNDWDKEQASKDGRKDLGGDIMIHGGAASVGCLAMGNQVAEDLFVLAARTGVENIRLVISPVDFRVRGLPSPMPSVPPWTPQLYSKIRGELDQFPEPMEQR